MRLVDQVRLARCGSWAAAIALFAYAANVGATPLYVASIPIALLLYIGRQSPTYFGARALRRMMDLSVAERFDEAEKLLVEIEEIYPRLPIHAALFQLYRSTLLLGRGRAAEAVTLLDALSPSALKPTYRTWRLNNLSWALVESGDGPRALRLAKESAGGLDEPETNLSSEERALRPYQLGTLGAAHVVAGNHDEGIPLLERALRLGGPSRSQAARFFYLGKAAHALGRHEEAVRAWSTAAALTPSSRFTRSSTAALETLGSGPYRGGT